MLQNKSTMRSKSHHVLASLHASNHHTNKFIHPNTQLQLLITLTIDKHFKFCRVQRHAENNMKPKLVPERTIIVLAGHFLKLNNVIKRIYAKLLEFYYGWIAEVNAPD